MIRQERSMDMKSLGRLEERLKRGLPKWEHPHFIEMVVPDLVARLREYMRLHDGPARQD